MRIGNFGRDNKTNIDKQKGTPQKNMNSLQSGDKFKATILDIKRNEITIRLSDGNVITAKSLIIPEARIGDIMEFTVQDNKEGQILLSMFSEEQGNKQQLNSLLNVLVEANIVPSDETINLVKMLMDNNLPVDKATLQNLVQTLKTNPELDMETLVFMLKEDIAITSKNIEQVKLTAQNENKITNQINDLAFKIAGIDDVPIKEQVLSIFLPEKNEELNKEIKAFTLNLLENVEIPEHKEILKEISKELLDLNTIDKNFILNTKDTGEIINFLQQKYPEKAQIFNLIKDDLEFILKDILDKTVKFEHSKQESQLQLKPEELARVIKDSLFIDIKNSKPEELNKFYQELYDKVTKAMTITEKGATENTRETTKALSDIKENIQFMDNLNKFQEFIQIPFKFGNTNNQGDLYVFSDKAGKKLSKDKASVLLSLDLSMLGHFEVFIQKDFKNISCQFRTIDKKVQSLIQVNISKLQNTLKQKGYNLNQIMYKTIEEPFNILTNPKEAGLEMEEQAVQSNKRYSFDMRV